MIAPELKEETQGRTLDTYCTSIQRCWIAKHDGSHMLAAAVYLCGAFQTGLERTKCEERETRLRLK